MTRLIGYARVSTYDQNLNLQIDALKKAGCSDKLIFVDNKYQKLKQKNSSTNIDDSSSLYYVLKKNKQDVRILRY